MKKLKQLIEQHDYTQAKAFIIDHRDEIEEIADCLLGFIGYKYETLVDNRVRHALPVIDDEKVNLGMPKSSQIGAHIGTEKIIDALMHKYHIDDQCKKPRKFKGATGMCQDI